MFAATAHKTHTAPEVESEAVTAGASRDDENRRRFQSCPNLVQQGPRCNPVDAKGIPYGVAFGRDSARVVTVAARP